ncbi:hypothetical protein CLF_110298 [Clonorchis sinensis]|uniref:Uncharacterized protein n=1 Tax=Clonorchis sinensis TaxID=79923 RepID=G7YTD5_CLOSI|nr:hypothetical protein CLF_110298 [Clonorchis sinensis]
MHYYSDDQCQQHPCFGRGHNLFIPKVGCAVIFALQFVSCFMVIAGNRFKHLSRERMIPMNENALVCWTNCVTRNICEVADLQMADD